MRRPNSTPKLTDKQVIQILQLKGKVTTRNLALRYDVSKSTIIGILSGKCYSEVREKWLASNSGDDDGRQ
jgi:hypothetical protein